MTRGMLITLLAAGVAVVSGAGPCAAGASTGGGAGMVLAVRAGGAVDTLFVAARELPRGRVLRAGDVDTLVTHGVAADGPRPDSPGPGWTVRRLVRKGEPLQQPAVAPPQLIMAGSPVTLVWEVGDLRVTRAGTAVGPAYQGGTVVVRVDARRRFTGVAIAPGTVLVSQP